MIKWGIIGPGAIAHAFAKEVGNTSNGKLAAVYGRNEERAEKFANEYNIEKYYSNIDEFLEDKDVDAVYIAVPHSNHMEYAVKCIEAKKHILCEKPFSYNRATSEEVLKLAKENKVFIMEALWTMFLPAIKKAQEWIKEGRIGKVKLITANFGFKSEDDFNGRLYNPELAGGALLDVGIYTILLSNLIMNDIPKNIDAAASMTKSGVDESDVITLKYEGDTLASLTCSIKCATDNTAYIYGEKGNIVIPKFWMAKECYLETDEGNEKFEDNYEGTGYMYEIEHAAKCIEDNILESDTASHKTTLELASIMDEIRGKINLVYPFE